MSDADRHGIRSIRDGKLRSYLSGMGPSWLAGAIAAGPATLASVVSAGATFGYTLLWVVLGSAVLGAAAQYLSMRLGVLTGEGVVTTIEAHLGSGWAWLLVLDVVLAAGLAQLVIMKGLADVSATLTGVDARIWGVAWAVVLAIGLAGGGYRVAEAGAKLLVSAVVLAFLATLIVVPVDPVAAAGGLVPRVPAGVDGALLAAGVLGGAVHVTLLTMHPYTVRQRGWTEREYGQATFDVGASMLVAFGIYSLAAFLVAASVLYTPDVVASELTAVAAGQTLGPLVGANAELLFLLGLWGAAVSTLGGNTVVPPYLLADKLGWATDRSDRRYRGLLAGVALLSAAGAFLEGSFFPLLVLVLAFGLVGTPFALAVVLYLLNSDAVDEPNSAAGNLAGVVLLAVTALLAGNFVRSRALPSVGEPLPMSVFLFAIGFGVATLVMLVKLIRTRGSGEPATA